MNWDKVVNLTEQKAKTIVNEHGAVGVQYAFMDSGKIVFSGNVGYKDKKGERTISSDTIYGIGSITKLFTTTAVMQLVESGTLHLDEKLMHYIPEFKMQDERYKEITIHMLLNHSAGLMFYGKDNVTFGKANRNYMEQLLDVIGKQHLDRAPGSSSSYCNTGFDLLALVVERVNGLSFLEYLKKNIMIPLQLGDTKTNEEITEISNMATPFLAKQGIEMPLEYANCIGAGGLYSTAEDLCRFGMIFTDSGNEILSKKSVKAMMEEQSSELPWDALENRDRFGLGFDTVKKHPFHEYGIQVISKGGSTTSYGSFLAVVPEYNLVMAFMSNGGNPLANEVAVINILMTVLSEKGVLKSIQDNHKKILSDEEFEIEDKYKIYAGYYANADNNYRITFEQNKMLMEILEASYSMEFVYKGNGVFYSEDGNNYRFFVEAHNGKKYIAASDEWSIQDIGCYKYEFYEAQKVDEEKITADLWNL